MNAMHCSGQRGDDGIGNDMFRPYFNYELWVMNYELQQNHEL